MKKHDHFIFPAILFKDDEFVGVRFPDLPGCNTFGKDADDALFMARDALGGHLLCMDEDGDPIPEPTPFYRVRTKEGESIVLVEVWLSVLKEEDRNRAVKKTVTIPNWLNIAATEAQVNFSAVLQDALKEKLGVTA